MSHEIYFDSSQTNPAALSGLKDRLAEHQSKLSLGQVRRKETLPGLIEDLGTDTSSAAIQYIKAVEYDSRNQTDGQWISSMIKAGIPAHLVLKAWDFKDDSERNLPH